MNFFKIIVSTGLFLCVCFATCRKFNYKQYEEDPGKSDQPPHVRARGAWFLDDLTFKGNSIENAYSAFFGGRKDMNSTAITVAYDEIDRKEFVEIFAYGISYKGCSFDETFFHLGIPRGDSSVDMLYYTPLHFTKGLTSTTSWRVTKLYKNEMRMVLESDSGQYKMFLSK